MTIYDHLSPQQRRAIRAVAVEQPRRVFQFGFEIKPLTCESSYPLIAEQMARPNERIETVG